MPALRKQRNAVDGWWCLQLTRCPSARLHHINAFEDEIDGIQVDMVCYNDDEIARRLTLENLRHPERLGRLPAGEVRRYELLSDAQVTLMTERRRLQPWALQGGGPGARGRNSLRRAGGPEEELPAKALLPLQAGDVLSIETPGGGGWGSASA